MAFLVHTTPPFIALRASRIFLSLWVLSFTSIAFVLVFKTFGQLMKFASVLAIAHNAILLVFAYFERYNNQISNEERNALTSIYADAATCGLFFIGYYWALSTFGLWKAGAEIPGIFIQLEGFFQRNEDALEYLAFGLQILWIPPIHEQEEISG